VIALDLLAELGAVDVGVDLRRRYILVTEEELNSLEVRTALEECCGEAVTEGVGADLLLHTCHLGGFAHHDEDGDAGDGLPTAAEEDVVLLSTLRGGTVGVTEIAGDLGDGGVTQRDEALLAPLALYAQIALIEEEVGEGQVTQLAHTQAAAEEHLDDGTIALALDTALAPCGLDDAVDLGSRQHGREVAPLAWHLEERCGVAIYIALEEEIAPEGADTRDDARDRRRADAQIVECGDEVLQSWIVDGFDAEAFDVHVAEELIDVAEVSLTRIL